MVGKLINLPIEMNGSVFQCHKMGTYVISMNYFYYNETL